MARQYEWRDISVVVLGRTLEGIKDVKYSEKQDKELVFGRGNKALGVQRGRKTVEGSITLLQNEVDALTVAAKTVHPLHTVLDISFDIIVAYNDGALLKTDTLVGCQIKEYEKGMGNDDKFMEISLPFLALDIVSA
jgi:hypothetical protein